MKRLHSATRAQLLLLLIFVLLRISEYAYWLFCRSDAVLAKYLVYQSDRWLASLIARALISTAFVLGLWCRQRLRGLFVAWLGLQFLGLFTTMSTMWTHWSHFPIVLVYDFLALLAVLLIMLYSTSLRYYLSC